MAERLQVAAAAARAESVTKEMTQQGKPLSDISGTTFLPSEEKAFCLFDAAPVEHLEEANALAKKPSAQQSLCAQNLCVVALSTTLDRF